MKDESGPALVLFRRDLRIGDNAALHAAAASGKPVAALYVHDEESGVRPIGAAARWWLHHSLDALRVRLHRIGVELAIRRGKTGDVVESAIGTSGADAVFWNRRYDPADAAVDATLKSRLRDRGLTVQSFDGALLHEPSRLKTSAGGFYKVYTPFWRALEDGFEPRDPIDAPRSIRGWSGSLDGLPLDRLELLPTRPDWSGGLADRWTPGEEAAQQRLEAFVRDDLRAYEGRRDLPREDGTSRLSPHLAFGEVTPFQIVAALKKAAGDGRLKFRKEIAWREFSYHLLFHNPKLAGQSFRPEFDAVAWRDDEAGLRAWQRGRTGYPIVDAGLRQLWRTGWMHNRVRMIAASFLIKDLLIDWRKGERWFWDTLVDADAANNPASWQWVAGSGADAAPYFRVFNPVLQGEKFDPKGDYVRRFVPEIARLPDRFIHRPWEAPPSVLAEGRVILGKTYPRPIVDHARARLRSLAAYEVTREKS